MIVCQMRYSKRQTCSTFASNESVVEQPDGADERPRSSPTGHGGGALRVLAIRLAPGTCSSSGVSDICRRVQEDIECG